MKVKLTLVDNVPVSALSTVTSHNSVDVISHHSLQSLVVPVAVRNPRWELAVPNKGMATQLVTS